MTPAGDSPNFDRVASIYRWAEYLALGPLLERTRFHFLPHLATCRRAWVLGDGDGRFLARLLAGQPALHATAIDTSAAMLRLLTRRCSRAATIYRLRTIQASALTVPPDPDTDLVVTHFFLDCLPQSGVDALAQRIAAVVQPGCLWLVSDFALPPGPWLRPFAALYVRSLYLAFGLLTGLRVTRLPDPASALHAAGFTRIERRQWLAGLLYAELWQRTETASPGAPGDTITRPASPGAAHHAMSTSANPETPATPRPRSVADAQPDPEPIAPSLAEPDPGVFHHEPAPLDPSRPRKPR